MLITIAGCGALGCSLGARMIASGLDVQAYGRPGSHLEALAKDGIILAPDWQGKRQTFPLLAASNSPSKLQPTELIIVLVKAHQTAAIAPIREILKPDGVCLTLQNGLGNAETLAPLFGQENLAAGIATYGSTRKAPGVVDGSSQGFIIAGPWLPGNAMNWVGELLADSGLNSTWVKDPRPAIWNKLCLNAMMNPVAALTGQPNGKLLENDHCMTLMRALFDEAATAADRAGVMIDRQAAWDKGIDTIKKTAKVRPSMLQDLDHGARTETDAISGGVLAQAQSESDFPQTRAVHAQVKAIDARNGHADSSE
ncbi:ketopantoate reductase family protein [Desulfovibrio ferrophilus]|uniref:2-dehydropantoate 2-reductase n=1 Tax=Desulfovibrio ferrophilus TaxID=241368 RepID=A0A2Z6AYF7_9BACT|nr:2-dehydropantoate 2-reductase [Desulfovibrio ferrophilus]BBD08292.1 2-dehydropantoate 2-reductase [Desulfovibrio ferrophilus]